MADGTTALDLYGRPVEDQRALLQARIAELRGENSLGALMRMSGSPEAAALGQTYMQQSHQAEGENVGGTSENVLKETLQKEQNRPGMPSSMRSMRLSSPRTQQMQPTEAAACHWLG